MTLLSNFLTNKLQKHSVIVKRQVIGACLT
jgi:hypothetical protein